MIFIVSIWVIASLMIIFAFKFMAARERRSKNR